MVPRFWSFAAVLAAACGPTLAEPDDVVCWSDRISTDRHDSVFALAVDSEVNTYVVGATLGQHDADQTWHDGNGFVIRYGRDGRRLWTRELGGRHEDSAASVALTPSGNVVVGGALDDEEDPATRDLGVELDPSGTVVRRFEPEIPSTALHVVVASDGSVYFAGLVAPDPDLRPFVARFDQQGRQLWFEMVDSPEDDWPHALTVDEDGNAYVVGSTSGPLASESAGGGDVFIAKLAPDGERAWTKQLGTAGNETAYDAVIESDGTLFVTGKTARDTNLDGEPTLDSVDGFVLRLGPDGELHETMHFGTVENDYGWRALTIDDDAVAALGSGHASFVAWLDSEGSSTLTTPVIPEGLRPSDAALVDGRLLVAGSVGDGTTDDVVVAWLCE